MTALQDLFKSYRDAAKTEREKGTYFEELIITYFRYEATYRDLYSDVWTYADWAKEQGLDARDTGIDLVAKTQDTYEYHAIQCKFYAEDYRIQKKDIDSFFTASGQKPFTHRVIVATTNHWSDNAENSLRGQQTPVTKIDLYDLENSQIDWSKFQPNQSPALKVKYDLRPHQDTTLKKVIAGLNDADRGKLIMACGTGKTFTSLKIAESLAGKAGRVLFLVPSLSLLSQTLTEWTQQSTTPLHSFAVCSDSDIGKKRVKDGDIVQPFIHELRYPATTNAKSLANEMSVRHDADHMSVVFSTYHSIAVISEAQHEFDLGDFDLIICDEAHRTTGSTFADEEDSKFVRVHDNEFITAAKRLYMTATPRIYAAGAKAVADKDNTALYSMDDEAYYGKELHVITFSEAVRLGLLVDYKVIVLTVDAAHISTRLQSLLADENNQLKVDDAARIIGCWKALSKHDQDDALADDADPMRRALAFCQVIEPSAGKAKKHKVSSKNIANMFQAVVEAYQEQEEDHNTLVCEADHVDGNMNATTKESKLQWLKEKTPDNVCRVLSNVRCLSEGVDVPALDAVLFLTPRNSQVDVVQSVGRIMRTNEKTNKTRGYVILPVVIPTGVAPHDALNDNQTYRVVWEVLQALRSHDDRFDAHINKLDLIGKDNSKMEVIAITDRVQPKARKSKDTSNKDAGKGSHTIGTPPQGNQSNPQGDLTFEVGEIERALYAKVVQKCGNRNHWEGWAKDIAKIAKTHIIRITTIVSNPENKKEVAAFKTFAAELRDDLNDSITDGEVIEMLAQHLITKPVFDALFKEYSFAGHNPVSQAMQQVLEVLQEHHLDKEADTLEKFYASVQMRAEGIDNAEGKQKIVVELYDKFFRNAFPQMTERLGIVYTPVEVVDFIIHSVNDVLKSEFNQTLGSEGVHIIDPFTGTGTFITRMLQSGLISKEQLPHKYRNEIHANEIILLAYYIAAINIEAVYHSLVGGHYKSFEGICLTDTFQLYEKDDLISDLMVDNSARRTRQKELDIHVIVGNPPYSTGQSSANDGNQNVVYPCLDENIGKTYGAQSAATLQRNLFDPYIRAIRWGSDRIGRSGIMAYVSGSAWVERSFADGMRKCLVDEFTNLFVFHLRGDIRKNMLSNGRAREGENIFGSGSMTGIAISVFVKNPDAKSHGHIYYHEIDDDLSTIQKLATISNLKSINGITAIDGWEQITPDNHNDWIGQRDENFYNFIEMGNKKDRTAVSLFETYSLGVVTNRDAWCYNFSKRSLFDNMEAMISFYNAETERYIIRADTDATKTDDFINNDPKKISWTRALKRDLERAKVYSANRYCLVSSVYRPYQKQFLYFSRGLNETVSLIPQIFPNDVVKNRVISISGVGARAGFSVLMVDAIPNLDLVEKGQCFPLKLFEENVAKSEGELFALQGEQVEPTEKDGLTDAGLEHFNMAYPGEQITKEDIFYYIYGLLHSPDYRARYVDNLFKQLPRIPCVKTAKDFWMFVDAGRRLGTLHVDYEGVELYPVTLEGKPKVDTDYFVTKMKFSKSGKEKDKSTVIYNDHITIKDIPLEAYDYIVNGKAALDWVMGRQCVRTDKKSGIVNDANLYATETMGNAKYPLELFQRVITISLETMKIVRSLPDLDIDISNKEDA